MFFSVVATLKESTTNAFSIMLELSVQTMVISVELEFIILIVQLRQLKVKLFIQMLHHIYQRIIQELKLNMDLVSIG